MKVVVVYNNGSGGRSSIKEVTELLAGSSFEVIDTIQIKPGFEKPLEKHIKKGEIIAVVGGDGTMSAVAGLLKGTGAVMMPLPGGTLNHFTKDLGIPQSLADAVQYFKTAKKVKIDTAQVGTKTFINNSSIGVYSDSLLERDEHEKKYGKWPAMVVSLAVSFFRFRTYEVRLNGKSYISPLVFVGNNKYLLSGLSFERSKLNAGVLTVFVVVGKSRMSLFLAAAGFITGRKNVPKKLRSFTAKEIVIHTNKRIRVSTDGEHEKVASPLKYSIDAASLYVLLGPTKDK
jgi:diacylglycerol kinase family enzyme